MAIKLSDAIRDGAEGREQIRHGAMFGTRKHDIVRIRTIHLRKIKRGHFKAAECCAIGAAILGGVDYCAFYWDYPHLHIKIVNMNDSQRKSFDEIADWLDEQYPDLMVASWK